MLEPLFQIFGLTIKLTLGVMAGLLILWFKWAMVNPFIRIPVSIVVGVVATLVIGVLG